MRTKFLTLLASATLISAGLVGCASMGSSSTISLLKSAGFYQRIPETQKQKELFAATPAYKLERVTFEGKTFYAYKDEKNGVAYVGDGIDYAHYEKLVEQRKLDQHNYQAVQMDSSMASGWYGLYGPYYGGSYNNRRHR